MFKVGVIGKQGSRRLNVEHKLKTSGEVIVHSYSTPDQLSRALKTDELNAVVFVIKEFKPSHIDVLRVVANRLKGLPLVVVASEVSILLRKKVSNMEILNLTVLDQRFEMPDLSTVLGRLSDGYPLFHRRFCRYRVHQSARIVNAEGESLWAAIVNLSLGGAQMHFYEKQYDVTEKVFLEVDTGLYSKRYIPARIIWVNNKTNRMGVQFLQKRDRLEPVPAAV